MRNLLVTVFLVSAFSSYGFSGTQKQCEVLGFSPDSKYFSFRQFGTEENWSGEGTGYSTTVFIIDVKKNAWAVPPIQNDDEKIGNEKSTPFLNKFHISTQSGSLLPISEEKFISETLSQSTFKVGEKVFELQLERISTSTVNCNRGEDEPSFMIHLTVSDSLSHRSVDLQKDRTIPTSRYCPRSYEVNKVILSPDQKHVAVILGVSTYDFEGDEGRFMAITGPLP